MQVRVIGCSGSQPGRGQACSGYLVSTSTTRVLIDCGFGVAARLTGLLDPADLDAIVVTHRHLDHSIDLLGLFRVLWAGEGVVAVHAAAEVDDALLPMVHDHRRDDWERICPWTTVSPGDTWTIGDLDVVAHASDHRVPTVSLRLQGPDGASIAYSSDSGGDDELVACARDVDLLLAEATWQGRDDERRGDGHMTATRAARIAVAAGARSLVLTHLRPELDPAVSRAEASAVYDAAVVVARDGLALTVEAGRGIPVEGDPDRGAPDPQ